MPGFQGHIAKSVVVKNVGHANPKVSSLVEVEWVALARTWELIIMMAVEIILFLLSRERLDDHHNDQTIIMFTMTRLDLLHRLVLSLLGMAGMDPELHLGSSLCLCSTRTCSRWDSDHDSQDGEGAIH